MGQNFIAKGFIDMPLPDALHNAVVTGVQRLLVLRLPGTPARDTIEFTALVWTDAIAARPVTWNVDRDLKRFAAAFRTLEGTSEKWPNPSMFMQCLPAIPEQLKLSPPRNYAVNAKFKELVKSMRAKTETEE